MEEFKILIQDIKPSLLKPNSGQIDGVPKNPRFIKDDKFKKLVKSIIDNPEMLKIREVVAVDTGNELVVVGGNMRVRAAIEAGISDIPVKILPKEMTVEQIKAFIIKDNVPYGDNDWDLLANEWDAEELEDWGMELPDSFDNGEVEEDEAPEVDESEPPKSELGKIYQLGRHRVMCGDSTDIDSVELLMAGNKADMIFTDPPYGVDYDGINNDDRAGLENLLTNAFSNYVKISKLGASIYCFHSDRCADIFHLVFREYFHFSSMIIWEKNSLTLSRTDYQSLHEPCFYGWVKDGTHQWFGDRKQTSIWHSDKESVSGHTTPKPIAIVSKAINNSSKSDDIVSDLFLGSGSTLIACEQTNRICYGMELDPKYVDVIRKRYHKFVTGSEDGWEENTPAIGV